MAAKSRVKPGGFYGNMFGYTDVTDTADAAMEPPMVWVTNAMDRSPAELVWIPQTAWGPLGGSHPVHQKPSRHPPSDRRKSVMPLLPIYSGHRHSAVPENLTPVTTAKRSRCQTRYQPYLTAFGQIKRFGVKKSHVSCVQLFPQPLRPSKIECQPDRSRFLFAGGTRLPRPST